MKLNILMQVGVVAIIVATGLFIAFGVDAPAPIANHAANTNWYYGGDYINDLYAGQLWLASEQRRPDKVFIPHVDWNFSCNPLASGDLTTYRGSVSKADDVDDIGADAWVLTTKHGEQFHLAFRSGADGSKWAGESVEIHGPGSVLVGSSELEFIIVDEIKTIK